MDSYNAHSKQHFRLHITIIWTISDLRVYADLSGWSIKGYKAYPSYHKHTSAKHLSRSMKMYYMKHR